MHSDVSILKLTKDFDINDIISIMLYDNWFGIPDVGKVSFHAIGQK